MDAYRSSDLIVAGATLGGCLTAMAAAQRGARVIIVEPTPFLGVDITAVLRPWVMGRPDDDAAALSLRDLIMPAEEAVEAAKRIKPKIAIPMHYDSLVGSEVDARAFAKGLEGICEVKLIRRS